MSLSDGDKAECMEISRAIVKEVLKEHIESCPHHRAFLISKARVIGIISGVIAASGITSGAVTAIIVKLISGA